MTDKLGGKLDYSKGAREALAKWMDKPPQPKRDYSKWRKKAKPKAKKLL